MKNNLFQNFKNWCNLNQGLLTFLGLVIAVIAIVPFNKIDFGFANSFLGKLASILSTKIVFPFYLLFIVIIITIFYFVRIKNRYTQNNFSFKSLQGTWKCEWGNNEGSETFKLTDKGEYLINGIHFFNLTEFKYNSLKNEISFYKTAIQPGDDRKVLNLVKVVNNELLEGLEKDYKIKYSKISL